jgi:hypothetical protein
LVRRVRRAMDSLWGLSGCEQFLSAIRQYRKQWDEQRLAWKPAPFKAWTNHFADMLSYADLFEDKMTNEEPNIGKNM